MVTRFNNINCVGLVSNVLPVLMFRMNFIWFDSTTFLPYSEEAAGRESVMVRASGGLQLASILHVLGALTPNAKSIFLVLAKYQEWWNNS